MTQTAATDHTAIREFRVSFSDEELADLRRRISATRWPERETVTDDSQGVRLAMMQELARHWATDYDWRRCEARLNALPQFMIEIDGLDIHFIHVRCQHEDALPLIVTHGWPGSIIEQLKIIEPLTNPTARGAGPSARTRSTSSTTTRWTAAATSPPGSSRSCSAKRSARASGRCATTRADSESRASS